MKEIEAIRTALAAVPTPGPWIGAGPSFGQPLPVYLNCVVPDYEDDELPVTVCDNTETSDANYIAACNPAAMQKIIAHIDAQQSEIERLREALKFYAEGDHFIFDRDEWDTVSGEPQNFWCDEAGTATVEDGTIAKLMLAAMKETP